MVSKQPLLLLSGIDDLFRPHHTSLMMCHLCCVDSMNLTADIWFSAAGGLHVYWQSTPVHNWNVIAPHTPYLFACRQTTE